MIGNFTFNIIITLGETFNKFDYHYIALQIETMM